MNLNLGKVGENVHLQRTPAPTEAATRPTQQRWTSSNGPAVRRDSLDDGKVSYKSSGRRKEGCIVQSAAPAPTKAARCRYFTQGQCRNGDKCKYSHSKAPSDGSLLCGLCSKGPFSTVEQKAEHERSKGHVKMLASRLKPDVAAPQPPDEAAAKKVAAASKSDAQVSTMAVVHWKGVTKKVFVPYKEMLLAKYGSGDDGIKSIEKIPNKILITVPLAEVMAKLLADTELDPRPEPYQTMVIEKPSKTTRCVRQESEWNHTLVALGCAVSDSTRLSPRQLTSYMSKASSASELLQLHSEHGAAFNEINLATCWSRLGRSRGAERASLLQNDGEQLHPLREQTLAALSSWTGNKRALANALRPLRHALGGKLQQLGGKLQPCGAEWAKMWTCLECTVIGEVNRAAAAKKVAKDAVQLHEISQMAQVSKCRFFSSKQGCRSGIKCKFLHDDLAAQGTKSIVAQQLTGTLELVQTLAACVDSVAQANMMRTCRRFACWIKAAIATLPKFLLTLETETGKTWVTSLKTGESCCAPVAQHTYTCRNGCFFGYARARYRGATIASCGDRIFITGGEDHLCGRCYNPATPIASRHSVWLRPRTCTEGSYINLQSRGPQLDHPRQGHCVVVKGDCIYILGGRSRELDEEDEESATLSSVEVLRPQLRASRTIPQMDMRISRCDFGCVFVHNDLYILGGLHRSEDRDCITISNVEFWNASLGRWIDRAPMRVARCGHGVAELNGYIYVAGGWNSAGGALDSVEKYNPKTDSWQAVARLPFRAIQTCELVANGASLYFVGLICDVNEVADSPGILRYDFERDAWDTIGRPFNDASITADPATGDKTLTPGPHQICVVGLENFGAGPLIKRPIHAGLI